MVYKYEPVKCYHCGHMIETFPEYVKKDIPLHTQKGVKMIEREMHWDCAKDLAERFEIESEEKRELESFTQCYELFREWLGVSPDKDLGRHTALRIKGLYVGKYYPNGQNTKGLKRGYEYEVIYLTMLFVSDKVRDAIRTVKFSDDSHRVNYIMSIIINNINFVQKQYEKSQKASAKLERETENVFDLMNGPDYEHVERKKSSLAEAFAQDEDMKDSDENDLTELF